MNPVYIILIVVAVVLIGGLIALYLFGRRAQKKADSQQEALEASAQTISFFIIDKKKMKIKEAGLPKIVYEQTPKYLRRSKLPILKVKVGPKVMSLICEAKLFETLLPKQEVKATVSGIYVTAAKRIRGPVYEPKKKKKFMEKYR